ncbi:hypothetical protein [Arthrobacter sp. ok362]|uniref:hypothetical protein n=1 Tax=Arthrobacter sp. ok362 TaxID=1761745 RepID=UPI001114157C|nr:hypothetical protein [Arthrobacter sp. ok362]
MSAGTSAGPRALGLPAKNLDHIVTSKMRVGKWEAVINIDSSASFIGTIASDHNMVNAVLQLP